VGVGTILRVCWFMLSPFCAQTRRLPQHFAARLAGGEEECTCRGHYTPAHMRYLFCLLSHFLHCTLLQKHCFTCTRLHYLHCFTRGPLERTRARTISTPALCSNRAAALLISPASWRVHRLRFFSPVLIKPDHRQWYLRDSKPGDFMPLERRLYLGLISSCFSRGLGHRTGAFRGR